MCDLIHENHPRRRETNCLLLSCVHFLQHAELLPVSKNTKQAKCYTLDLSLWQTVAPPHGVPLIHLRSVNHLCPSQPQGCCLPPPPWQDTFSLLLALAAPPWHVSEPTPAGPRPALLPIGAANLEPVFVSWRDSPFPTTVRKLRDF